MQHIKHELFGLAVGLLLTASSVLAFTVLVQRTTTTPATSTVGVSSVKIQRSAWIHRIVFSGPSGATGAATGTVSLTDNDGTSIASFTLTNSQVISGTTTTWVGSAVTTNGSWYTYNPVLSVTNGSTSNLTFSAVTTGEE